MQIIPYQNLLFSMASQINNQRNLQVKQQIEAPVSKINTMVGNIENFYYSLVNDGWYLPKYHKDCIIFDYLKGVLNGFYIRVKTTEVKIRLLIKKTKRIELYEILEEYCKENNMQSGFATEKIPKRCDFKCLKTSIESFFINNSRNYPNVDKIYLESIFGYELLDLHKGKNKLAKLFEKINKSIGDLLKQKEEERNDYMKKFRLTFLNNFFLDISEIVIKSKITFNYSFTIQFYGINIIRNTSGQIENWNINQSPFVLNYKCGKDTTKNVSCRCIQFLDENSGIMLLANCPENRSSLLYFNASNKQNPLISLIMTLSSPNYNLILEQNLKLWCLYDNKEKKDLIWAKSQVVILKMGFQFQFLMFGKRVFVLMK